MKAVFSKQCLLLLVLPFCLAMTGGACGDLFTEAVLLNKQAIHAWNGGEHGSSLTLLEQSIRLYPTWEAVEALIQFAAEFATTPPNENEIPDRLARVSELLDQDSIRENLRGSVDPRRFEKAREAAHDLEGRFDPRFQQIAHNVSHLLTAINSVSVEALIRKFMWEAGHRKSMPSLDLELGRLADHKTRINLLYHLIDRFLFLRRFTAARRCLEFVTREDRGVWFLDRDRRKFNIRKRAEFSLLWKDFLDYQQSQGHLITDLKESLASPERLRDLLPSVLTYIYWIYNLTSYPEYRGACDAVKLEEAAKSAAEMSHLLRTLDPNVIDTLAETFKFRTLIIRLRHWEGPLSRYEPRPVPVEPKKPKKRESKRVTKKIRDLRPVETSKSLHLIFPSVRYKASALEMIRDLDQQGQWYGDHPLLLEANFEDYMRRLENARFGILLPPARVPYTELWMLHEKTVVGRITIAHALTSTTMSRGGHIGYSVASPYRRKGYASAALGMALRLAKKMGFEELLITCDDTNVGSIRVIEKNGGQLQNKITAPGRSVLTRRYFIHL